MALYVGSSKKILKVGDKVYKLMVNTTSSKLISSDNYVLKDKNDVFITAKDGEKLWL